MTMEGADRARPALEDVIEFAVAEFNVDSKAGYEQRLETGRKRWRDRQVKAAIRDLIRDDPIDGPDDLRRAIDVAVESVASG